MNKNWKTMNIRELVEFLNRCCDSYYDSDDPIISDKEYDEAYDRLVALENSTGIHLAGSPTQKVQGHVSDKFVKVSHSKPMLSCQKTKDVTEVSRWVNGQKFYGSYKMDGCFISSTRIKMADGTEKRISDVKVGDYVLSCNDSGQVEPKRVINTFYNGLKSQSEWVRVLVDDGHKKGEYGGIKCTKNHKFFTNKGWVESENLNIGDLVYFPHRICSTKQNEVLLGICLGDATLIKRGSVGSKLNIVEVNTSKTKNGGYDILIDYLENLFKSNEPSVRYRTSGYSTIKNNMKKINIGAVSVSRCIANQENWLRCGLTFTDEIISQLTPLSLAMLYIDDGSLARGQEDGKLVSNKLSRPIFHLNRHKKENVVIFKNYLEKLGIFSTMSVYKETKNKELGDGYTLTINTESSHRFFDSIYRYVPKTIRETKLPKCYWDMDEERWWEEDDSFFGLSPRTVVGIENCIKSKEHSIKSYDLEVEDNHNYFANSTLVHNCTLVLKYNKGKLIRAVTRGNGTVGEDVTENAKMISNLPLTIPFNRDLELRGECVMSWENFNRVNKTLEEPYSHPRNLAAGTIRQLDSSIVKRRNLSFVVFEVVSGLSEFDNKLDKFNFIKYLGFETVKTFVGTVDECVNNLKAENSVYPVDGLVFEYTSEKYGKSLGATAHHEQQRIALKWVDDVVETTLRDVIWQVGQSGSVTPVAVFDEVDLSGALTTRATLHNISIVEKLELGIGDTITVYRSNMVIPKVDDNLTRSNTLIIPKVCPSCGKPLEIEETDNSKTLVCRNKNCPAKLIARFSRFVSRDAMNIDGLSEKTLEVLLDNGYIKSFKDIYHLGDYSFDLMRMDGFGKTSVEKLVKSIEKSRSVKLENYLYAIGIEDLGLSACKTLSRAFDGDYHKLCDALCDGFDVRTLDGFGDSAKKSVESWFNSDDNLDNELSNELNFVVEVAQNINKNLEGLTVCITGKLNNYTRDELKALIEEHGGKVAGSVSNKTYCLITNELSNSEKSKKAVLLGVTIITENDFVERYLK